MDPRINMNYFREGKQREPPVAQSVPPPLPSPLTAHHPLRVGYDHMDAQLRQAHDVIRSDAPGRRETLEIHPAMSRLYPNPNSQMFVQGSSNQSGRTPTDSHAGNRIPESVLSEATRYGQPLQSQRGTAPRQTADERERARIQQLYDYDAQHKNKAARRQSSDGMPSHPVPQIQNHSQRVVHLQPQIIIPPTQPHTPIQSPRIVEGNTQQMIMERLDYIIARQENAQQQRHAIFDRIYAVESIVGNLAAQVASLENRETGVSVGGSGSHGEKGKGRAGGDTGKGGGADIQAKLLRGLTALAHRVSDIGRSVNDIEDTLGTADPIKRLASIRKGKRRASVRLDEDVHESGGEDLLADGSSAAAVIDVDALDTDESMAVVSKSPKSAPRLRGWQSSRAESRLGTYDTERRYSSRSKGRTIIDRLDSQDSILMDVAEWLENMRDPHADRSDSPHPQVAGNGGQEQRASPNQSTHAQNEANNSQSTLQNPAPIPNAVDPLSPTKSPLFNPLAILSPVALQPTVNATGDILDVDDELMVIDQNAVSSGGMSNLAQAPVTPAGVNANFASGSREMDSEGSNAVDGTNMDVVESKLNVEQEEPRHCSPSAMLASEPHALSTNTNLETITQPTPTLTVRLPASGRFTLNAPQSVAPLTIKVKPIPLVKPSGNDESTSEIPIATPQPSALLSASQGFNETCPSPSKVTTPIKVQDREEGPSFGFSPVDWARTTTTGNGTQSLPYDLAELPTSTTPVHTPRILRSASDRKGQTTPSVSTRILRTPRRLNSMNSVSTPTQKSGASRTSSLKIATKIPEVDAAKRAMDGLLNAQARIPETLYALDAVLTPSPETNAASTPLTIRIPSQTSLRKSADSINSPVKAPKTSPQQTAERALKGLLHAQAVSPPKAYSVDPNIVHVLRNAPGPSRTTLPAPSSTDSREQPTTTNAAIPYELPGLLDGSVAALRRETLGYAFSRADGELSAQTKATTSKMTAAPDMDTESDVRPDEATFLEAEYTDALKYFGGGFNDMESASTDSTDDVPEGAGNDIPVVTGVNASADVEQLSVAPLPRTLQTQKGREIPLRATSIVPDQFLVRYSILSDTSALTPVPESDINSAIASRSQSESATSVSIYDRHSYKSSTPLGNDHMDIFSDRKRRQMASESSTSDIKNEVVQMDSAKSASAIDEEIISGGQSSANAVSSSTTEVATAGQNSNAPLASQESNASQDENDVHDLVLADPLFTPPSSSTRGMSPMSGTSKTPQDVAKANGGEAETPSLRQSSECLDTPRGNRYDGLQENNNTTAVDEHDKNPVHHSSSSSSEQGPSLEPVHSGLVQDAEEDHFTDNPLSSMEIREPSSSSEGTRALNPRNIIKVKQELDNALLEHPSPVKGNRIAPEAYIYSDSKPTRKPSTLAKNRKQKNRAPSVIVISSDDDDDIPLQPTRSNINDRSMRATSPTREGYAFKSELFDEPMNTSTPVKRRSPKVSQSLRNQEVDEPVIPERYPFPTASDLEAAFAEEGFDAELSGLNATSTPPIISPAGERYPTPTMSDIEAAFADDSDPGLSGRNAASTPAIIAPTDTNDLLTKELSPFSELSRSPSPVDATVNNQQITVIEGSAEANRTPASVKKYIASMDSDDDIIIPNRKRKVSGVSESATEDGAFVRGTEVAGPSKKGLLLLPKKGPSLAATKIKKRKAVMQAEDERPLKKAKARMALKKEEKEPNSASAVTSKDKGKKREQPIRTPAKSASKMSLDSVSVKVESAKTPSRLTRGQQARAVQWPHIEKPNFDQFIECNTCNSWYHFGCVGVAPNDRRLDESEEYKCPPCIAGVSLHDSESPSKYSHFDDPQKTSCCRPKCQQRPKKKKKKVQEPEEESYVVESFIGRRHKMFGGTGKVTLYLVKWLEYPVDQCTWENVAEMGLAKPEVFIVAFENAAAAEDFDLGGFNAEPILLKEAVDGGWRDRE